MKIQLRSLFLALLFPLSVGACAQNSTDDLGASDGDASTFTCDFEEGVLVDEEVVPLDACNNCKCNPGESTNGYECTGVACKTVLCPIDNVPCGQISAADCPIDVPTYGSSCDRDSSERCYYCDPQQGEPDSILAAFCENGVWTRAREACSG